MDLVEALQVVHYLKGEFYQEHYDNKAGGEVVRVMYATHPSGGVRWQDRELHVMQLDLHQIIIQDTGTLL